MMDYIIGRLKAELDPALIYHSADHTLDVYHAVKRLNESEKPGEHMAILIETAAIFHDSGMILRYREHEEASATIARESLPRFGYTQEEINTVTNLIMATCLPQNANNLPEMILCDADLDALGRDDFFIQSFRLKNEWSHFGIADYNLKEWLIFQVAFLENHIYFTNTAKKLRNDKKSAIVAEIKEILS